MTADHLTDQDLVSGCDFRCQFLANFALNWIRKLIQVASATALVQLLRFFFEDLICPFLVRSKDPRGPDLVDTGWDFRCHFLGRFALSWLRVS